ncbi:SDR family NAD(P)-dependent oxidoreductase [Actinomarinicola tropica]|uniref:SDR family NAD(P)-dependent oxidoreductase n=1 Tax=Actinomarinicola tropica TaxID=2789776 RepID=A0A5Q2RJL0_9ACTN|nr:SDR family NAD(P)-dependent oxidoreductase [Actinomarinicola tropica]
MDLTGRPFAVVTGASTGIGRQLGLQMAERGYDLLVTADDEALVGAAEEMRQHGTHVDPVQVDLRSVDGVDQLVSAIRGRGRAPDALLLNAGTGVSGAFLDEPLDDHLDVLAVNVTSVLRTFHAIVPDMVQRGDGRVLITSSVTAAAPGPYISVYSASKAFLQSFSQAVRTELSDSGVTVTALMPGPTDTEFFERADMLDTRLGQMNKDDPADVARDGIEAMLAGKDHVVGGAAKNHLTVAAWSLAPEKLASAINTRFTKPGTGD